MASPGEKSSSSRSTTSLMPGRIVIACDATKNHSMQEFQDIIGNIQRRKGMIEEVDTITVLGVLYKVLHPMGFQMQINQNSFIGARLRAIKEEVSRMVDEYVRMLHRSAEECDGNGVNVEVKIVVGAPLRKVVAKEAAASNATWVVLNKHLRKELRFYLKYIPCKMALVHDNFSLEVLRSYYSDKITPNIEQKVFYIQSKIVPLLPADCCYTDNEQPPISPSSHSMSPPERADNEKSGGYAKVNDNCDNNSLVTRKQGVQNYSNVLVVSTVGEMKADQDPEEYTNHDIHIATADFSFDNVPKDTNAKTESSSGDSYAMVQNQHNLKIDSEAPHETEEKKMGIDQMQYCYSEVQAATRNFSSDNFLGEGGFGAVYKGQLRNGQMIIVKVLKEVITQGCTEFQSQVSSLSMACHKNIVMLLGYCLKEDINILIYEYVCNRTLQWHLFDNTERVLEWYQRYSIAIGVAKGLRYLHEECRGSPITHRDISLSNIFLTHEYVPLLGDCGLAKWKTNKLDKYSKDLDSLEYLSPECAENGICSMKTDVFAFGIVLIQLISGRKVMDLTRENHQKSLRQWAMPLIQSLALDDLVDPRLGDSYGMYELYQMARVAYSCIQSKPAMRPTIGEVLRILEGEYNHQNHLIQQFKPHLSNMSKPAGPPGLNAIPLCAI